MATPPRLKSLSREDFADVSPDIAKALDKLFALLNPFMTSVTAALTNGLTFGQNVASVLKEVTVDIPAGASFSSVTDVNLVVTVNELPTPPQGCLVVKVVDVTDVSNNAALCPPVVWKYEPAGNNKAIKISGIFGLTEKRRYKLTLLVFSG